MKVITTNCICQREPLASPFGFKGSALTELWQTVVYLCARDGNEGIGLGVQSVLWSDANVFAEHSEHDANNIMFLLTQYAAQRATEVDWDTPGELLDHLLPATLDYGKRLTGRPDLRTTFALNALVPVDNAAWLLYSRIHGIKDFSKLIPTATQDALTHRQSRLAVIPLMTYGIPIEDIITHVDEGCAILKIKIGSDPNHDGDLDKMLEWDKNRLTAIHDAIGDRNTPHTTNGRIAYYLDANGRYDTLARLSRLLDHADHIGALERIILLEEPFPEHMKVDVGGVPVRVAADESAHAEQDALERINLGYKAIALKPIAKTLSMTFRILRAAHQHGIPGFCADLTVNPVLVDWNKNVAARLAHFPGMRVGVLETNGPQNYANWAKMQRHHPCFGADWLDPHQSVFTLGDDFYNRSGGIFEAGRHYYDLVRSK